MLFTKKTINFLSIIAVLFTAIIINGCSESTSPSAISNVEMKYTSNSESPIGTSSTFRIDSVKILVREIKLQAAGSSGDSVVVKTGPLVLELNMNAEVKSAGFATVPENNYRRLKFEIHKLNSNEVSPDPEFRDSLGTYSVIVKGEYLGTRFVYKSTKSAHQFLVFNPEPSINTTTITKVMLRVKPYLWFIENGAYLNPMDPANENNIDNNIKENINGSFEVYVEAN